MIGCLCLHGFTGEPWEVEPVATYLLNEKRWLVYTPTLPGHGLDESLKEITYQDWLLMAETAMEELLKRCEKVYVVGFSFGGMLACYIAAKFPVAKLVLLSAAAYYLNPMQFIQELKDIARFGVRGRLDQNDDFNRYKRKIINTPLTSVYQFMLAVKYIKPYVEKVKAPTLILQGGRDGIVPRKSAFYLFDTLSSKQKEIEFLQQSKHFICHGFEKELLINKIDTFLTTDR